MTHRHTPADRAHRWYAENARRYDRLHPGIPGDLAFYAALCAGQDVLELGAGTGRVSRAIAATARSVIGLEPESAMLRRARGWDGRIALVQGDARRLPLRGPFGCVIAPYRMLHHLESGAERERLFREVVRVLAPGGVFAFDTWHGPPPPRGDRSSPPLTPIDESALRRELATVPFRTMQAFGGFCGKGASAESFTRVWVVCSDR